MTETKPSVIAFGRKGVLPCGSHRANDRLHVIVDVAKYFERMDIKSGYLRHLILRTLWKIVHSDLGSNLVFGSLIEGQTISGAKAEVTGDHCIRIDSRQLNQLDEDVAMAVIAHELAHDHLRHFKRWTLDLDNEHQADNLAREWGFDIDRFRKVCGPPSINSRLMQIHFNLF